MLSEVRTYCDKPQRYAVILLPWRSAIPGYILDDGEVFDLRTEQGRRALFERMQPFVDRPCSGQAGETCEGER